MDYAKLSIKSDNIFSLVGIYHISSHGFFCFFCEYRNHKAVYNPENHKNGKQVDRVEKVTLYTNKGTEP